MRIPSNGEYEVSCIQVWLPVVGQDCIEVVGQGCPTEIPQITHAVAKPKGYFCSHLHPPPSSPIKSILFLPLREIPISIQPDRWTPLFRTAPS